MSDRIRRGDIVLVAAAGDYGKPRPAVVVQTDALPPSHGSLIVCQLTSTLVEASDFRVSVEPDTTNGLHVTSQIMADKPVTIRLNRVGPVIGRLDATVVRRLDVALGLADDSTT